jgi:trehalose-6-phosphate synthase
MSSTDSNTVSKNDKNLRLLVVSNRLPVTVNKDKESGEYDFKMSSGGLVAALSGLKKMMSFTWIGWPGKKEERGLSYMKRNDFFTNVFFYFRI